MVQNLESWPAELKEILNVCAQRASLPVTLPHCAICARYATDNLPFEALLSLLDVLPEEHLPQALAAAEDRLSGLPAAMRQQHVNAVTLPVLLDSPGGPLVRSLIIDLHDQAIHKHFDDPRLQAIEEITLLGFAYGGCKLKPAFCDAFFNSRRFPSIRSLSFHSTESNAATSKRFWASSLARQLERIDGVPYFGDPIAGPLAVRELTLAGYGDELPEGFSLSRLLDPSASPQLRRLTLNAYFEGLSPLLQVVTAESRLLERIEAVSLQLHDSSGEWSHLLQQATLPASVRSVICDGSFGKTSQLRIRSGSDVHALYDSISEKVDIRSGDRVSDYGGLLFDWRLRDRISRRVEDLSLFLPLEIDVADVIAFCDELPGLKDLTLVYPFTEAELKTLLLSERIRRLEALTLLLSVGGKWDVGGNEYVKANESCYQSPVPPKRLFELAFGEATASIHNLSIATRSFELTRSPERVQHWDIKAREAAYTLTECDPGRPIEVLCFTYDLTIDEPLATALAGADVFDRVYRLNLQARLDESAGRILANCERLRNVRAFSHFCYHNPIEAIQPLLHSASLSGVWDVDLYLPAPWKVTAIEAVCADSPLLDRAVALDLHGPDQSPLIPRSGRLGRVRQLGEWLTMRVFDDVQLATVWKECPLGLPLRTRLSRFVERSYCLKQQKEEVAGLEKKLLAFPTLHDEQGFEQTLRDLLATAFEGKPAEENAEFDDLSEPQQSALRAIAQVDGSWWKLGGMMSSLLAGYGFRFRDKASLEEYIAGTEEPSA